MDTNGTHSRVARAIELIETSEGGDVDLDAIAAHVAMSPYHFARLFGAITGVSPIAYLRRHRLERAAAALVSEPGRPIAGIAFDAGYESQQAFNRAFRRAFGRTPTSHRRNPMVHIASRPEIPARALREIRLQLEPQPVEGDGMRLAGAVVSIDGINGKAPRRAWEALFATLPDGGRTVGKTLGICWPQTSDGTYDYMAAIELPLGATVPKGLTVRDLPPQRYAVFHQYFEVEDFPGQLKRGLEEIWAEKLPQSGLVASGGPDLELYADDFVAGQTAGVLSYWIPVA